MSIRTSSIFEDSSNFLRNQFNDILLLSFFSAIVSVILYHFIVSAEEIDRIVNLAKEKNDIHSMIFWIQNLSRRDKLLIFKASLLSLITIVLGFTTLNSSLIIYLNEFNKRRFINSVQAIYLSLKTIPKMLILLILHILTVYFGLLFFIIPGVVVSIGFSFSPIILIVKEGIIPSKAILESWNISFRHFWKIVFILLIWTLFQVFLSIFSEKVLSFFNTFLKSLIHFTINNLFTSFVLIYFFRLYTLIYKNNLK
ncbi:YciC family protein [Candidatus Riesia pediculicola]|uniref:YciC family protein n=1 Tax=Candidatus Riesia pediculicola TaxID=401619 RepID=UPI0009B7B628|nr:YciC family protein [Candidatus Riesia pediculicola]ARC53786.1 hypothetical protein AOE55_01310 [Candidatus Riesia pediculicola]